MSFCFLIIAVLSEDIQTALCWQDIFIPCVMRSFLSFIFSYLTGRMAYRMFKKVHRNELNMWLGSLSI